MRVRRYYNFVLPSIDVILLRFSHNVVNKVFFRRVTKQNIYKSNLTFKSEKAISREYYGIEFSNF